MTKVAFLLLFITGLFSTSRLGFGCPGAFRPHDGPSFGGNPPPRVMKFSEGPYLSGLDLVNAMGARGLELIIEPGTGNILFVQARRASMEDINSWLEIAINHFNVEAGFSLKFPEGAVTPGQIYFPYEFATATVLQKTTDNNLKIFFAQSMLSVMKARVHKSLDLHASSTTNLFFYVQPGSRSISITLNKNPSNWFPGDSEIKFYISKGHPLFEAAEMASRNRSASENFASWQEATDVLTTALFGRLAQIRQMLAMREAILTTTVSNLYQSQPLSMANETAEILNDTILEIEELLLFVADGDDG